MGSKKLLPVYTLTFSPDNVMTGTATVSTEAVNVQNIDNIALDLSWTGTAIGTITVQCSVDGVTYRALTFSPVLTQPAGASGGYLVSLNQLPYNWVKVSYTNTSSTGAIFAKISGKDVN